MLLCAGANLRDLLILHSDPSADVSGDLCVRLSTATTLLTRFRTAVQRLAWFGINFAPNTLGFVFALLLLAARQSHQLSALCEMERARLPSCWLLRCSQKRSSAFANSLLFVCFAPQIETGSFGTCDGSGQLSACGGTLTSLPVCATASPHALTCCSAVAQVWTQARFILLSCRPAK